MRILRLFFSLAAAGAAMALTPASASLLIAIDKSTQQMTVSVDGDPLYVWPVSTGVQGHETPSGDFKPFRMERDHFSREWDDAPMPHSIFFTQTGHAIHGSGHVRAIGTPASHGCVRLEPRNASILFALVKREKMANTRVVLTGETPVRAGVPVARQNRSYQRQYATSGDDEFADALPPPRRRTARGWREYSDGDRAYYYREQPRAYYYVPAPPPQRYYRSQFGW